MVLLSCAVSKIKILVTPSHRSVDQAKHILVRCLSSESPTERMRVAIVGGGVAGLSSALHLAPLVDRGIIEPIDVYESSQTLDREIGVGVWSTALDPFQKSNRESHQAVYQDLTKSGSWIGDAGYRVPTGNWLLKSHLPTSDAESEGLDLPGLLFLREKDLIRSLQKALHWEERKGTMRMKRTGDGHVVSGLAQDSQLHWSSSLSLTDSQQSTRDYHLVVAADGMNSLLRQKYGGFNTRTRIITGTDALMGTESILPHPASGNATEYQRLESVGQQDRGYTVFRGNAPLSDSEVGIGGTSFQTWGTEKSMRFATVPMNCPISGEEEQVWFATLDDDHIVAETDIEKRKSLLLQKFAGWHDPVHRIMEATPAEDILMERATAHRHCVGPVLDFNATVEAQTGRRPPNSGRGPCIVFIGDAYMTVDPILAQGFSVALEGASVLPFSVEDACLNNVAPLGFDPIRLRKNLHHRHENRMDRLISLLRSTELVQALGQPVGGTMFGFLNTHVLRPVVQMAPSFVKQRVFNAVLKYSVGLSPFGSR